MSPARAASLLLCALLAVVVAGCGGGASSTGVAALTKSLSPDADSYAVVDLAALREDLGLEEESDPLAAPLSPAAAPAFAGLLGADPEDELISLLELDRATAAASSDGVEGAEGPVSVIRTAADTGEIGSALGDAGYVDRDGILIREDGPSFLLDVGLIYVAADAAPLRELPEEPKDDPPDQLLDELEAPLVEVQRGAEGDCVRSVGATGEADGSGEIVFLTEDKAEAVRVETGQASGFEFGKVDENGASVSVEVTRGTGSETGGSFSAIEALEDGAVSYAC